MFGNKFFLVFLAAMSINTDAMNECTVGKQQDPDASCMVDMWQNAVKPHLTLQSIGRFAQTCRIYKDIFEPGKIKTLHMPCFLKVEDNYYRCTHALSRFAQHNNAWMFKVFWGPEGMLRNINIERLEGKECVSLDDRMNAYCKYYGDAVAVDKQIIEQLKDAIKNNYPHTLKVIVQSKKYNIFELFNDNVERAVEQAFFSLCNFQLCVQNFDDLLSLLPVEDGEQKNRAVQYIAKYDQSDILTNLLEKDYLKVNAEYGHKCTLLHYAALRGCRRLTDDLLKKGADVHAINAWGKQPLDYAHAFNKDHAMIARSVSSRGSRVIDGLSNWCTKKHLVTQKTTNACIAMHQSWKFASKEERDWLLNSCTYSLANI